MIEEFDSAVNHRDDDDEDVEDKYFVVKSNHEHLDSGKIGGFPAYFRHFGLPNV